MGSRHGNGLGVLGFRTHRNRVRQRHMVPRLLYIALQAAGFTTLARRIRNAGVVLCYHNVEVPSGAAEAGASGLHMPVDRFRNEMRWLVAHYDVLPLSGFLDRVASGESMHQTASVTFDDAYAGVFEHAWPVLRDLGIPATVFVITGAPGRNRLFWWDRAAPQRASNDRRRHQWLTTLRGDGEAILRSLPAVTEGAEATAAARLPADWEVIAQAARSGVELGVHSATHRALPALGDDELVDEIETSRTTLSRETGTRPSFFAFPYGLWDERVRSCVQHAGYRAAFTLDYGLVRAGMDPWALPRVNVPAGIRDPAYQAWAAGLSLRHALGR